LSDKYRRHYIHCTATSGAQVPADCRASTTVIAAQVPLPLLVDCWASTLAIAAQVPPPLLVDCRASTAAIISIALLPLLFKYRLIVRQVPPPLLLKYRHRCCSNTAAIVG
jgi:hypothetical protein